MYTHNQCDTSSLITPNKVEAKNLFKMGESLEEVVPNSAAKNPLISLGSTPRFEGFCILSSEKY
jgi:hypothetical protein